MSYSCGSLFSGGGLADQGMRDAGFTPRWGVEIDHEAADAYERNLGPHMVRRSVWDVDPRSLPAVDLMWASPPCPMYSKARSRSLESDGSEDLGLACIPFIEVLRPRAFVLENVTAYQTSVPFRRIAGALQCLGYWVTWDSINTADYGVPQTRSRLVMRAVLGSLLPPLPPALPWVGWYHAIEDLLPTLPHTRYAAWQLLRLRADRVYGPLLIDAAAGHTPAFVIDCTTGGRLDEDGNRMLTIRDAHEPLFTLVAQSNRTTIRAMVGIGEGRAAGRVVDMTTRALARFQSVPDSYVLPDRRSAAVRLIGNGVPCLLSGGVAAHLRDIFSCQDAAA